MNHTSMKLWSCMNLWIYFYWFIQFLRWTAHAACVWLLASVGKGIYLLLPGGGGGQLSRHPKQGVKQINFGFTSSGNHSQLDLLTGYVNVHANLAHWKIIWNVFLNFIFIILLLVCMLCLIWIFNSCYDYSDLLLETFLLAIEKIALCHIFMAYNACLYHKAVYFNDWLIHT